ncbi:lipase family protein [Nocardia jiangsuensis]|uniref:Lipase family protein n=1 Tax=Nocardia jiangsuensis TaxID=1691563 RepID=A0ABV8DZK3_9NOCA
MKTSVPIVVAVLVGCALMGAPASAAPPYPVEPPLPAAPPSPLQAWIEGTVPAPPVATDEESLWRAILPSPSGDPILDTWPADLAERAPGEIIEAREVTATTALRVGMPVARSTLLKFRSTSGTGAPSFGTATLIVPVAPWTGPGSRPVEVNALPINSLGLHCTPGYQMSHGLLDKPNADLPAFLPAVRTALGKGHAVLLPDHEGPFMAYADPNVAAHVMLDAIRAARGFPPGEFGESRYVAVGYSGGAIAAYAAAMKLDEYAPELAGVLAGAAAGGVVTDYVNIAHQFNGRISSGILLTVTLALAREHPEILRHINNSAQWVATSPLRDICGETSGPLGIVGLPVETAADTAAPLDSEFAAALFRQFDLTARTSSAPLFMYHAAHDPWIPLGDVQRVFREQCGRGVPGVFRVVPGEHLIGYVTGAPELEGWVDGRLRGIPAPSEC